MEHTSVKSTLPLADAPKIVYNLAHTNIEDARSRFVELLGHEHVLSDVESLKSRSGSPWYPSLEDEHPDIIVKPISTSDVSQILKVCSSHHIPVIPWCGGTGLHGSTIATKRGVCVDLSRMDKITELHEQDMDVVVQPAVDWQELNRYLEQYKLFFPPDPAPGAKIGGMIAMNCSGTNAYRYGTMKDWVISVTVVLPDGSVVKTRGRPRKSSAGYDLTHLIVGSEGTLGIVTEAILKLANAPVNPHVAIAYFPSTELAVNASVQMANAGQLDALEFIDEHSMRAINKSKLSEITWNEKPSVFIKLSGSLGVVKDLAKLVESTAKANGCLDVRVTGDTVEVNSIWHARKAVGRALVAMKSTPTDLFISADAAVPRSNLAESINETHRLSQNYGFFCSTIGHIGDGNVHTAVICTKEQEANGNELIHAVRKMALRLEGTVTGEHGVGTSLRDMLVEEIGESGADLIRKIKLAVDPGCILNPDKVVRMNFGD